VHFTKNGAQKLALGLSKYFKIQKTCITNTLTCKIMLQSLSRQLLTAENRKNDTEIENLYAQSIVYILKHK